MSDNTYNRTATWPKVASVVYGKLPLRATRGALWPHKARLLPTPTRLSTFPGHEPSTVRAPPRDTGAAGPLPKRARVGAYGSPEDELRQWRA